MFTSRELARGSTVESGARAERTCAAILAAAEREFARRGFVAARLEDIAAAVGLTRPALFYHFRDKQSLYDAVIEDAFGSLVARLHELFDANERVTVRIERAVEAWVDTIVARPTIARLIMHHAAEADADNKRGIFQGADRLLALGWSLLEKGRKSGELAPLYDDPFRAASAVIGPTVFYVAALGSLLPESSFHPLTPEQIASHKQDALRSVRGLLGTKSKIARRPPSKRRRRT